MKRLVTIEIDKCGGCYHFSLSKDGGTALCNNTEVRTIVKSSDDYICIEDVCIPDWCLLPLA